MADVPAALARLRDALVDLQLVHRFDEEAQPIATAYRVRFQVPNNCALDAVDRAFQRHLAVDAPDFGAIDFFLGDRACTGVARPYAEALASYVRGVLVKDRPMAAAVTLPFARYRDLYVVALDGLEPYRRPLADLVCAAVRFALNNFGSPATTGFAPLDGAYRSLAQRQRRRGSGNTRLACDILDEGAV